MAPSFFTVHHHSGEKDAANGLVAGFYGFRQKGGNAIVDAEEDAVVAGMYLCANDIFGGGETVSSDVANQFFAFVVVLPDAHGRAHPQVAVSVLHDGIDALVGQIVGIGEALWGFLSFGELVEPVLGADEHGVGLVQLA